MTPMEIALLATGVIIFVISFLVPDKTAGKSKKDNEKEREEIRRLMEKELDGMKLRVNEATDETVEYAIEKTERSLEKVSNEKIMAVSEYSDTIMEEINKSHKEVMFLYDMLSDKQTDLKNTVRKAEATAKEVEKNLNVISVARVQTQPAAAAVLAEPAADSAKQQAAYKGPVTYDFKKEQKEQIGQTTQKEQKKPVFSTIEELAQEEISVTAREDVIKPVPKKPASADLKPKSRSAFGGNNNQKILDLYKQGKSNMQIAKELNLGVGEVKLVIDLFKG